MVAWPSWIAAIFKDFGLDVDQALVHYNELAKKYEVPIELNAKVMDWLMSLETTVSDPRAWEQVILGIVLELKGKHGYNPDAAGVA